MSQWACKAIARANHKYRPKPKHPKPHAPETLNPLYILYAEPWTLSPNALYFSAQALDDPHKTQQILELTDAARPALRGHAIGVGFSEGLGFRVLG